MRDSRMNGFLIVAFASWFCGAVSSALLGVKLLGFFDSAEMLASVFFVFALSLLFFGRFSAFSMFFAGLISGPVFLTNITLGVISLFAFFLASFGGTLSGFKLFDDFHGSDNFYSKEHMKQLGLYLTIALFLAFIPAIIQGNIPAFGLNDIGEMIVRFGSGA